MRKVAVLPSFERSLRKLALPQRKQVAESLEAFNLFLLSGEFAPGFGFKKINCDKYEFRAGLHLRVIVKREEDVFYLVLVGDHDDVKRYLRTFR
ncbi:MAG: hypothetical protein AUJ74_07835 [Candidatus Omnitrophica bacterium CG1_02_44_16]|nr:MAG: hypothetical protein AUJ74_07835 [Candidatus Omnitrophica bacterium CG1_02_44_16]PIY84044.1 MAG: hypothetical protein COY78_00320 [Candidatus Omnitrophica bacterium CG_4_10_14_0_8_um_filter_44_12]PIZ83813.1 MAG: hypothetical protein COX96_06635 [Candidatus Omnitrophica bacterium CG_4_10_14_0_2_um_filter_44_9]